VNNWKVIWATLVIFGAGVITGGLLVGYSDRAAQRVARRSVADHPAPPPRASAGRESGPNAREMAVPPALRKEFLDRLNRELSLSPEQRERIETIIRQGQEHTRDLWRVEMMATRQKIRAALTPEQQTRFQELLKQRAADQRNLSARDRVSTNSPEPTISSNAAAGAKP
jgi:hypothetical protein